MEATFSVKASELEEKLTEKSKEQGSSASGKVHTLEEDKPKSTWDKYLEKRKSKRRENRLKGKADRKARKEAGDDAPDAEDAPDNEADLKLLVGEDENGD